MFTENRELASWEPDPTKKAKHAPKAENRRVKIDATVAAALRLYVLTGARRSEILNLTWDMVDLERGLLFLQDSKTGQKTIILSGPAQLVLSELPRVDRFVIPGQAKKRPDGTMESRPRSDLKRPWAAVRKRAGLDADADNPQFRVRLHDLRHTHASIGVGSNLGLPIVGKQLGHKQTRTTETLFSIGEASETAIAAVADAMKRGGGLTGTTWGLSDVTRMAPLPCPQATPGRRPASCFPSLRSRPSRRPGKRPPSS